MQNSLSATFISRFHLQPHLPRAMSSLARVPKSGRNWTQYDLSAYNIKVVSVGEREFFGGIANTIPAGVKRGFLEHDVTTVTLPEDAEEILGHLSLAHWTAGLKQSAVHDFAKELLKESGYRIKARLIRTKHLIPLFVLGNNRFSQTDVSIIRIKREELLMLLQESKPFSLTEDAESQVIAQAIAAFQVNNRIRRDYGHSLLDRMVFPCISMCGTYPNFYLVPVTMNLSDCVSEAAYPSDRTLVLRHFPKVSGSETDTMVYLRDKIKILQCLEAFKKFVDNFYLVPVTTELSNCVAMASYPSDRTVVQRSRDRGNMMLNIIFNIIFPRSLERCMKLLGDRRKILQCFEAFNKFVDNIERELETE